jgi:hypothetical protein
MNLSNIETIVIDKELPEYRAKSILRVADKIGVTVTRSEVSLSDLSESDSHLYIVDNTAYAKEAMQSLIPANVIPVYLSTPTLKQIIKDKENKPMTMFNKLKETMRFEIDIVSSTAATIAQSGYKGLAICAAITVAQRVFDKAIINQLSKRGYRKTAKTYNLCSISSVFMGATIIGIAAAKIEMKK